MSEPVRAKAGLPWPVSGVYLCDKCHARRVGQAGTISTRCARSPWQVTAAVQRAYYVLIEPRAPADGTVSAQ